MKYNANPFIPVFFVLSLMAGTTQGQFRVDAQLRNRFEFRDGYQQILPSTAHPAFLVSQRTRVSFFYQDDKIQFRFTPQDVRVWGDEQLVSSTGVFGDQASLDLFEGYAALRIGAGDWVSIGRQQLVYDNQRLLAQRNWNQLGISYDAILLKFRMDEWNVHLAGSWNSRSEINSENLFDCDHIKSLNFVWINRKIAEYANFSLMHIASGVTETDTTSTIHFRQTTGLYTAFKKNNLSIWADGYYQYGKNQAGHRVSAFLAGAEAGYKAGKFTPGLGFEYLSGNHSTGAGVKTDRLFDLLYGARHRYLGYMDYFRNIPGHTKSGGIVDVYAWLDFSFSKTLSIRCTGHYFQLAQTNPGTPADRDLGYENDLVVFYRFNDWGALEGGYMFMLPSASLKTIQQIQDEKFPQFAYVQLTLTPTLFQHQDQKKE